MIPYKTCAFLGFLYHYYSLPQYNNHTYTPVAMDFVNKFTGGNNQGQGQASSEQSQSTGSSQQQGSGGFLGGIGDKLNSAAGGGRESEKNEDYVDKGKCSHERVLLLLRY